MSLQSIQIDDVLAATNRVQQTATKELDYIKSVTSSLRVLALNARIEASRAGNSGRAFGVVAEEVSRISATVDAFANSLSQNLVGEIQSLDGLSRQLSDSANLQRMIDLSLNAVELIDRNLYERTCDVRWWATDSAIVSAAETPSNSTLAYASKRLGVILKAYTVYLDIWLCDLSGTIIANGRPDLFSVVGSSVKDCKWFEMASRLRNGDEYAVGEIAVEPFLQNSQVATYVATVRSNGESTGKMTGVLAVHFDWKPQSMAIVEGVRLTEAEKLRSRVLLLEETGRILASSDRKGVLTERLPINFNGRRFGVEQVNARTSVAFHKTPGYETYKGQGWYGAVVQTLT